MMGKHYTLIIFQILFHDKARIPIIDNIHNMRVDLYFAN